jgi:hypothetical protein
VQEAGGGASSRVSQGTNSCSSVPDMADEFRHAVHRVSSISQPTSLYTVCNDNVCVCVSECVCVCVWMDGWVCIVCQPTS